jgi:hypothetical protein
MKGRPLNLEELQSTTQKVGKHRAFTMSTGTGLIPMGDRARVKPEFGVDVVEDRDSDPNIRRI